MFADLSTNLSDILDHPEIILEHPEQVYPLVVAAALLGSLGIILLHLVLALIGGRGHKPRRRLNLWEKLVYLATLFSVTVLGVTAFYSVLELGGMRGWWLFVHMFGAGALVGVLPLIAITWAGPCRFGRGRPSDDEETFAPRFFRIPKLMFWLFLAAGLTVILTMLLSMLPLFGTDGLHVLLDIHRYAGLLAVVVLALHCYCLLLQRARLR